MRFVFILAMLASFSVPAVAMPVTTAQLDILAQRIQTDRHELEQGLSALPMQRILAMSKVMAANGGKNLDGLMSQFRPIDEAFVSLVMALMAKEVRNQRTLDAIGVGTSWAAHWQAQKVERRARTSVTSRMLGADARRDRANTPENQWRILIIKNQELLNRLRVYH